MPEVELSSGTIAYEDTGGDGPVLVFLHGVLMDHTVWRKVVPDLRGTYRCVLPTLPLGSHRKPMHPDADLSLRGQALLVGEFLDRLGLDEVTLVLNDWGGAQLLLSEGRTARIARLALVACEAFDNYPPGKPGRSLVRAASVPGGLALLMNLLRLRPVRRVPNGWGAMTEHPVPDTIMDAWFRPARTDPDIRRDLAKYLVSTPPKARLLAWSEQMRSFDRPVLIAWAAQDRLMPREHGPRLAELLPRGRLAEIEGSRTLVPEDRPDELVRLLRDFMQTAAHDGGQEK
ncbi:alpha/beta fold hydrolase [Streptomyces sp. NBC_00572]|uniref:alpha/beta fold hydrolase n=1 Tax=Streptomyces sp. NBC_00572 TaxID=2903664 RepID=UPI00224CBBAD|nr:alpha/beta hydrolase [Streptomyces sp. NBC_00572]MCX4981722.1 alpha/beta hydrolase [Streptomyces sp. NBC_00572]